MKILKFNFSDLFDVYYRSVIQRTGLTVSFHHTSKMRAPFCWDDAFAWSKNATLRIYLNTELSSELAEILAAHELTHEVLTSEGFPVTRLPSRLSQDSDWQNVRSRLGSSILNRLVNRRLKQEGFRLRAYYERGKQNLIATLSSMNPEITTYDAMRYNALVYLDYYLDAPPQIVNILAQFLKRVPRPQWRLAQAVVKIVEEEGIDDSQHCRTAMVRIRDFLGFSNYIFVVDPKTDSYY